MPAYPTLSNLNYTARTDGYWIRLNSTANQTFSLTGTAPTTTNQTLIGGNTWNLIGYPSQTSRNISLTLATITGNYDAVYLYNASDSNTSARWKLHMPAYPSVSDLGNSLPGYGYWVRINSTANQTLVIAY